jgi:hypothetical protein
MFPSMALAKVTGGRGWRQALALWLNANITAQNAADRIANFFVGIMFTFMALSWLHTDAASKVPKCKVLLNKYLKYLSINWLRHGIISRPCALPSRTES